MSDSSVTRALRGPVLGWRLSTLLHRRASAPSPLQTECTRGHTRHIGAAIAVFYVHLREILLEEKTTTIRSQIWKGSRFLSDILELARTLKDHLSVLWPYPKEAKPHTLSRRERRCTLTYKPQGLCQPPTSAGFPSLSGGNTVLFYTGPWLCCLESRPSPCKWSWWCRKGDRLHSSALMKQRNNPIEALNLVKDGVVIGGRS